MPNIPAIFRKNIYHDMERWNSQKPSITGTLILADLNSVTFITAHCVVLKEIVEKEAEVSF